MNYNPKNPIKEELAVIRKKYREENPLQYLGYYNINCNVILRDGKLIEKISDMFESNKSEIVRLLVAKGMEVYLSENPMVNEPLYLDIECPICNVQLMNMNNHPFGQFLEQNIAKCPECNKLFEKDKLELKIID